MKSKEDRTKGALEQANWISRRVFWWLTSLLVKGFKAGGILEQEDLGRQVPQEYSAKNVASQLEKSWKCQLNKENEPASILKAVWRTFGKSYALLGIIVLLKCVINIGQALLLGYLIQYFHSSGELTNTWGITAAAGIVGLTFVHTIAHHSFCFLAMATGMKLRVACSSLVYAKTLKLSQTSLRNTKPGRILTLLGNDLSRCDQLSFSFHYLWIGPLQASIVTAILWTYLGPSCMAGLAYILLYIPGQYLIGRGFSRYRKLTSDKTDARLSLITEILDGIKTVKMNGWEELFSRHVENCRREELYGIKKSGVLRGINGSLVGLSSKVVVFAGILTFVLSGGTLTPEKVFVSIVLYDNVRVIMTLYFPMAVNQLSEALVTLKKLQRFLLMDEKPARLSSSVSKNPKIQLNEIQLNWGENEAKRCGINGLTFETGSVNDFVGLVGPVGCGKTSLLHAVLGEFPDSNGKVNVEGSIAYAPQEPWIFPGTVRENIINHQEFNSQWYDKVVAACGLKRDLELFPQSYRFHVGESGASLSGGQKSRVSLARAVYSNAQIILLDDPFSSLDAKVANHVYQECLLGLLKNKLRVVVTHHSKFLRQASSVISICGDGSCSIIKGETFMDAMNDECITETVEETQPIKKNEESDNNDVSVKANNKSLLTKYLGSAGVVRVVCYIIIPNILCVALHVMADFWLKLWTTTESTEILGGKLTSKGLPFLDFLTSTHTNRTLTYSGIILALLNVYIFRSFWFFRFCIGISSKVHCLVWKSLISTRLRFFDQTKSGNILTRMGTDVGVLDEVLPQTIFDTLEISVAVLAIILVVALVVPASLVPVGILCVPFFCMRNFYLVSSKAVKRLEGNARAPLLSHVSMTIKGLLCIRSTPELPALLQKQFQSFLDTHSSAWLVYLGSGRWIGLWLDMLSLVFTACVTFSFFFLPHGVEGGIDGSSLGLVISSAMALAELLKWGLRQSVEVDNQLVSFERILEYSALPKEDEEIEKIPAISPPENWPSKGHLVVNNLSLKYPGSEKEVLSSLSFSVDEGTRLGVVGRTGAGKSSMISALLRLVEPTGSSQVEIDGIDISNIPLDQLRRRISVISQSPDLFSGTIRSNLDPFGVLNDDEMTQVLQEVFKELQNKNSQLACSVNLDSVVELGGSNFSLGQKQLICLARSVLKKSKLVIMDEATANLDGETDKIIQCYVRGKFLDCSVLTIAHRLQTVEGSHKVLVLDAGRIIEWDSPSNLLNNEESAFFRLVHLGSSSGNVEHENTTM